MNNAERIFDESISIQTRGTLFSNSEGGGTHNQREIPLFTQPLPPNIFLKRFTTEHLEKFQKISNDNRIKWITSSMEMLKVIFRESRPQDFKRNFSFSSFFSLLAAN